MAGRDEEWRPRQRLPEKGPHFPDDPIWVTLSEPRPGRIEALAERFSGRPFEEMVRDPELGRVSQRWRWWRSPPTFADVLPASGAR
jgi:hypothetical protein